MELRIRLKHLCDASTSSAASNDSSSWIPFPLHSSDTPQSDTHEPEYWYGCADGEEVDNAYLVEWLQRGQQA